VDETSKRQGKTLIEIPLFALGLSGLGKTRK
jgi:hypothetical protein